MATDLTPRFTLSLRGYDKDEVDEYLESLAEQATDADGELVASRRQSQELGSEIQRLSVRVAELEEAIRGESPHTVRALGERITLILGEAEAGAAETVAQAESRADQLLAQAREEAEELRRQAAEALAEAREAREDAQRAADDQLARAQSEARSRATAILGEAESRARRRQAQIEGWAQEVITATQADQAQMAEEFAVIRRRHESELAELTAQRDEVVTSLRGLQQSIVRAVDRLPVPSAGRSEEIAPPAAGDHDSDHDSDLDVDLDLDLDAEDRDAEERDLPAAG